MKIYMRNEPTRRLASAASSLSAIFGLIIMVQSCEAEIPEFRAAAAKATRCYADLIDDPSEEKSEAMNAAIKEIMVFKELVTTMILDKEDALQEKEGASGEDGDE